MKRDSILASVTGLFDSSTWAGRAAHPGQLAAGRYAADAPRLQQNHVFSQSIPEHLHGRLVLVAEDEPNRRRPGGYLRRDGFRTCSAMDGVEAMRLFRELRPDAVLLDVNLPGMDGLDVLRAIRDEGQTPSSSSRRWPMTSTSCLAAPGRGRLRRQTLQSRRGRGAPAGRAAARGGACERRAHPRRRHRDRRAGPRRGRARGRRALRAAATDADRVPPAGLPGIPAAALLLARIPDRALPAGKRRA